MYSMVVGEISGTTLARQKIGQLGLSMNQMFRPQGYVTVVMTCVQDKHFLYVLYFTSIITHTKSACLVCRSSPLIKTPGLGLKHSVHSSEKVW